ncbi:5-bromo-4-chloroindolyl phosphate hydrolysis protein [Aedoeadaptatus ivorii]|uniref:5-bromo-4-chloroindolyl phosphate hydrolysis protein n=1 Tax=Aedoeadaptatus ivorii TaxID=54006 RepID=A0A3S4YQL1_9FIRM|nr:5-bromo-4-chloroindolyl phosphate hydrolysis family protein [Peptoniphilus ivorii]MDQ0508375.1 5-bromo-4-chloroindolyl phosphate hydrolysis protein [Peptoniphilus ivorii]VEJ36352.1 5-bromo-4-chloroindolyl phosphate hydrolysis protein [Peptoniphilus ivorii]
MDTKRSDLAAGAAGAVLFLITYLLLKWHLVVALLLAGLTYAGVRLSMTSAPKIGKTSLEGFDQAARLESIYARAVEDVKALDTATKATEDAALVPKAEHLLESATAILRYLEKNPKAISPSEHFLEYYLGSANRILGNYAKLEGAGVSAEKMATLRTDTLASLDHLQTIFGRQLDGYYRDAIVELEVESDLLDKTVKLGGDL